MKITKLCWLFIVSMLVYGQVYAAAAIASIPGRGESNSITHGYPNLNAAEKDALKRCAEKAHKNGVKGKCKIVMSDDGPGYIAIVYGDNGSGYGYGPSSQEAINAAAGVCTKSYKNCQIEHAEYWEDFPEQASPPSCVPNTAVRQCHSDCDNGSCVLTYKNGCKVQVQVQPIFNPATTTWEYPRPQC